MKERSDIARGTVMRDILFASKILGYQTMYSVYLPVGHEKHRSLPVLYVIDGYEYILAELGNIVTILDNLIAEKKIEPIVAILIDHREPVNRSNNKRLEELNMNVKYLRFFTEEFIPSEEEKYSIHRDAAQPGRAGHFYGWIDSRLFCICQT